MSSIVRGNKISSGALGASKVSLFVLCLLGFHACADVPRQSARERNGRGQGRASEAARHDGPSGRSDVRTRLSIRPWAFAPSRAEDAESTVPGAPA